MTSTPASRLQPGTIIDGTWTVLEMIEPLPGATGGTFSVGYLVQDDTGREGYLKALDFEPIIRGSTGDPARLLQELTESFNFERDIIDLCRPMDRVVSGFSDGVTHVDGTAVPYIVFERADNDLRSSITHSTELELSVIMRIMHHVTVGMRQLHSKNIAHQDLKPSNVMMFEKYSKVGDLGRAARIGHVSVYDDLSIAGDKAYAAPELIYGHFDPDWKIRRLGSDMYLLGSLLVYLIRGQGCTPLMLTALDAAHLPGKWNGSFQEILPYLQSAFQQELIRLRASLPEEFVDEIEKPVREMCEPDPTLRGHPINRAQKTPYSLERYHPLFDQLAIKLRRYAVRRPS